MVIIKLYGSDWTPELGIEVVFSVLALGVVTVYCFAVVYVHDDNVEVLVAKLECWFYPLYFAEKRKEEPVKQQKLGKFGKNPGVETSFLPDRYDDCTSPNHLTFITCSWYLVPRVMLALSTDYQEWMGKGVVFTCFWYCSSWFAFCSCQLWDGLISVS